MKALLTLIFVFALGGLAFSGYLTYRELAGPGAAACAPRGDAGSIFGAPPCVYGFVMYLVISVMAAIALLVRRHRA